MFIKPIDAIMWTRSWDEFQIIMHKVRVDRKRNWLYR